MDVHTILTYQAGGSSPRQRNENVPHRRKPSPGLFKMQVLRANQQVGRVVACVLTLFRDARLVFFNGWAPAARERPGLALMTNPPNLAHLPCVSASPRVRVRVAPQGGLGPSFRALSACPVVIGELMSRE